ncbi:uncharacterized protein CBL_04611 [Carabus blaptoides fortunei]
MNAYEIHKAIINTYVLKKPGDTTTFNRDTSKDKRDIDVIRDNHKFLWDDDAPSTWEEQLSKKYYDKLFKEYCICDLTLYKENKVALRWRTEKEVVTGKGQFTCGDKKCSVSDELRTWEVNFAYYEHKEKKNALVKLRLCPLCSEKLNYRVKKREVKRLGSKTKKHSKMKNKTTESVEYKKDESDSDQNEDNKNKHETHWSQPQNVTEKSREEEFEQYLEELLF